MLLSSDESESRTMTIRVVWFSSYVALRLSNLSRMACILAVNDGCQTPIVSLALLLLIIISFSAPAHAHAW